MRNVPVFERCDDIEDAIRFRNVHERERESVCVCAFLRLDLESHFL